MNKDNNNQNNQDTNDQHNQDTNDQHNQDTNDQHNQDLDNQYLDNQDNQDNQDGVVEAKRIPPLNDENRFHTSQLYGEFITSSNPIHNQHLDNDNNGGDNNEDEEDNTTPQEKKNTVRRFLRRNKTAIKYTTIIVTLILFIFITAPLTVIGAGELGIVKTKPLDGDSDRDDKALEPIKDKPKKEQVELPARTVAVGDSTIALSNANIIDKYHGCRHEQGNWASLMKVERNISCAGTNAEQIYKVIKETGFIGNTTQKVYITAGSNSYREKRSIPETEGIMLNMVTEIRKKAPNAQISFVGYLPAIDKNNCIQPEFHRTVEKLNYYHDLGNKSMNDVATATKANFYDMSSLNNFNFCDQNQTYIRVPFTTPGASWHTTPLGHEKIAEMIRKYEAQQIPQKPAPEVNTEQYKGDISTIKTSENNAP